MRPSLIIGAIWLALGGTVIAREATRDDPAPPVRIGSVTFTDDRNPVVPLWLGVWFAVSGFGLAVRSGIPQRKHTQAFGHRDRVRPSRAAAPLT